jgi:hypothetical protein
LNFAKQNSFGRAASARFARLASGYPLHHLRGCATLAASVVPLLSLSLVAPLVRPRLRRIKNLIKFAQKKTHSNQYTAQTAYFTDLFFYLKLIWRTYDYCENTFFEFD